MFNLIRYSTHTLCLVLITMLGHLAYTYIYTGWGLHPVAAVVGIALTIALMLVVETIAHAADIDMDQLSPKDLTNTAFNPRS